MAEYAFNAKVYVTDEMIDTHLANLEHSPPSWLEGMAASATGATISFVWLEEEGVRSSAEKKTLTRQQIAEGIAEVAFGRGARSDLIEHARRAILEADAGEIDGEISDVAIQYSLFDEIVYG